MESSKGISLKDLKEHGISEVSMLIRDPIKSTWIAEIEAKIQSAEQVIKK